jgi:hypothetical protein
MKMSSLVKLTRILFPGAKYFQALYLPTLLMKIFVVLISKLNVTECEKEKRKGREGEGEREGKKGRKEGRKEENLQVRSV